VAACLLAVLAALYHADSAVAQVVRGATDDGHVRIVWEYDLQHATGELVIENLDHELEHGEQLYLKDLIPYGVRALRYDDEVVQISQCQASAAIPIHAFAALPPGDATQINFQLPTPNWEIAIGPGPLDYGDGFLLSATSCLRLPLATLTNYVTVRPIEQVTCNPADVDNDGDVDLADYAEFQNRYTGPTR